MKFLKFIIIIIQFIWVEGFCVNPQNKNQYTLSYNQHYSFIADVGNRNHLLIRQHLFPYEFIITNSFRKQEAWHTISPNSERGISIQYINLQNPEYFGTILALAPMLKIGIINYMVYKLNVIGSFGLGYVSKTYHRTENFRNTAFSSHIITTFGFRVQNVLKITKNFGLSAGIVFNHYSNGEMKVPNDGMNIPGITFGAKYWFNKKDQNLKRREEDSTFFNRKSNFLITPTFGIKEAYPIEGPKFLTLSLTAEYQKDFLKILFAGFGFSLFYDGSVERLKERYLHYENFEFYHSLYENVRKYTIGCFINIGFNFYPLNIITNTGYYLVDDEVFYHNRFYNRFGIRYFINKRWYLNITHKSNFFFKGDNIEFGFGYKFL